MNAHKLQVKVFFDTGSPHVELETFIPVLHGWIKDKKLPELLIDVANYAHVPRGPGVVLIGHESDYYVDETAGRLGLLYSRKREAPAPAQRLKDAFSRAIHAALVLEKEPALAGKIRLRSDELLFRINDRLLAPSNEETFAALRPELEAFCAQLFGENKATLTFASTPKQLFSLHIANDGETPLAMLLDRLGGAPAA